MLLENKGNKQLDHLIKTKCYITGMLYCIKNLVNTPSDFTTLMPLTDKGNNKITKHRAIFQRESKNS